MVQYKNGSKREMTILTEVMTLLPDNVYSILIFDLLHLKTQTEPAVSFDVLVSTLECNAQFALMYCLINFELKTAKLNYHFSLQVALSACGHVFMPFVVDDKGIDPRFKQIHANHFGVLSSTNTLIEVQGFVDMLKKVER